MKNFLSKDVTFPTFAILSIISLIGLLLTPSPSIWHNIFRGIFGLLLYPIFLTLGFYYLIIKRLYSFIKSGVIFTIYSIINLALLYFNADSRPLIDYFVWNLLIAIIFLAGSLFLYWKFRKSIWTILEQKNQIGEDKQTTFLFKIIVVIFNFGALYGIIIFAILDIYGLSKYIQFIINRI